MLFRPRRPAGRNNRKISYWISFSDLMAGLLLVFILLLIGTLIVSMGEHEEQKNQLSQQRATLQETMGELHNLDANLADILGIRAAIIERLRRQFEDTGAEISFDDATGAIRLGSGILFDEGSARLSREGQDTLEELIPIYYEALLGDEELRQHVGQIVFEGHTNSNYSGSDDSSDAYLFNLQLSQDRAYAAMEFVIANALGQEYNAKQLLAALGYSSSRLIYHEAEPDIEDTEQSRRIEIRFRLKDEEALDELQRLISEDVR